MAANYKPNYIKYDIDGIIQKEKPKIEKPIKPVIKQNVTNSINTIPISNMKLEGIYKTKSGGFIIVALKGKDEANIISIGEDFNGYILTQIKKREVIFTKNNKEYVLSMLDDKNLDNILKTKKHITNNQTQTAKTIKQPIQQNRVSRQTIKEYTTDMNKIWKSISIQEVKNGSKIEGFKVTRVKRNSIFEQLGLRRNDIIIRANNSELHSYADAFGIYKQINKLKAIQLVVLRNNQEVELSYDID